MYRRPAEEQVEILTSRVSRLEHVVQRLAERAERAEAALETLMGVVESLPRNEFGQEHYLAVDAAYRTVINEARRMLDEEKP